MNPRRHDGELAAGAVLGDLAPDESAAWVAHRPACAPCRELEAGLDLVVADLALAAPDRRLPPDLLPAVLGTIRGDRAPRLVAIPGGPRGARATDGAAPGPVPAGARPGTSPGLVTGRRPTRLPVLGLGLAAALAIAVGGVAVLGSRVTGLEAELAAGATRVAALEARLVADEAALATSLAPGSVSVELRAAETAGGATARVVYVPGSSRAFLVADRLPAAPVGHAYRLWWADAAGVHPLGTARHAGGRPLVMPFGVDLSGATAVMLTLDPIGGDPAIPGLEVLAGSL